MVWLPRSREHRGRPGTCKGRELAVTLEGDQLGFLLMYVYNVCVYVCHERVDLSMFDGFQSIAGFIVIEPKL